MPVRPPLAQVVATRTGLGGVVGQTTWGYLARLRGLATAWVAGGLGLMLAVPLYLQARRRDKTLDRFEQETSHVTA